MISHWKDVLGNLAASKGDFAAKNFGGLVVCGERMSFHEFCLPIVQQSTLRTNVGGRLSGWQAEIQRPNCHRKFVK